MALDVAAFKQTQRRIWSSGDYPDIARLIESARSTWSRRPTCARDRTCWTWRPAAATSRWSRPVGELRVTGLDLTPELFDAARRRAADAGVEIECVEGDAEALPYEDASFDTVCSAFGTMFAPRHERAAAELARVTRPGGTIAVAAWTPEGANGQMLKTVASHMPPPPPELKPPALWSDEQHMRSLLEPHAVEPAFERGQVVFEDESVESWLAYGEEKLGPMVVARAVLEPEGKWDALRTELEALYDRQNMKTDGSLRLAAEYLVTIARVPTA